MFSLFQKNNPQDAEVETLTPDSQIPRRMDLEERKAFRRDLLDQAIRETLQELKVVASTYRCRMMPMDARHHRFIAMIDVTLGFSPRWTKGRWNFTDIEGMLRKNAFDRFGLVLQGVYWRERRDVGSWPMGRDLPPKHPVVSDEEKEALMAAIRQGGTSGTTPPLHVGNWEYQTDLPPMDDKPQNGG